MQQGKDTQHGKEVIRQIADWMVGQIIDESRSFAADMESLQGIAERRRIVYSLAERLLSRLEECSGVRLEPGRESSLLEEVLRRFEAKFPGIFRID